MRRSLTALAAAAAFVGPVHALPPLQPHAALMLIPVAGAPPITLARIDDAFRQAEARKGMFLIDPPALAQAPIRACARRRNPRPCLRPILLGAPRGEPTVPIHIAVLVRPAGGDSVRLTCIGAGRKAADEGLQSIVLDLARALSADPAAHDRPLENLSRCVFSAMNENLL